jgi:RNase H-fold protein (predicted Holliday junction resolvase)
MLAADMTRAKRHERRDALAATWILQSALDRLDGTAEDD